ncbi:MAG: peptide/nickel transport system substrate-binding protein [Acidimicrobiaceae bacterium]
MRPAGAALAVACAWVLLLAACSDSAPPKAQASASAPASGSASASAPGAPRAGGTLRVGIQRPRSLDPAAASPGSQSELLVADLLFDGLPSLATDKVSDDQRTWTFSLRAGAQFANGRPITAADAKYSLERVAKRGEGTLGAVRLESIVGFADLVSGATTDLAGLKALDARTLEIDLSGPLSVLPELLSSPIYGIVPREAVEAAAPAFSSAPVGSGPFSFAGVVGDQVRLVRAAGGGAYLDAVELHLFDDLSRSYDEFVAGHLDWSLVPAGRVDDAGQRFGTGAFRPFQAELFYAFNLLDPTFADVRFRQAIVKAIDRHALANAVYQGVADPLDALVPDGVEGHTADPCGEPCRFDQAAARALLAAVFPDGAVPTVHIDYDQGADQDAVAATIESSLKAVGIPVERRPRAPADYDQFAVSGQQQLFRLGWIGLYPSPDAYLGPLFASTSRDNATGLVAGDVDQLLAAARAQPDPASRVQLYQQAEQRVLAQFPIVPIAQFLTKAVVADGVRDLTLGVDGTFAGDRVWLDR